MAVSKAEAMITLDLKTVFMFDIDGVLCESQQPVGEEMKHRLLRLARHYPVYFLTGNTYTKSVDLIGGHIKDYSGIFVNSGDELRTMRGKLIWRDTDTPVMPPDIETVLYNMLERRGYPHSGNRIEWRNPRSINFSVIGRNATLEQRAAHDPSWRAEAIEYIMERYPQVEASIGGSISIDICSRGANKARAAKYINSLGKRFIFVGDRTDIHGNDYPVKLFTEQHTQNICLTSDGVNSTLRMVDEFLLRV